MQKKNLKKKSECMLIDGPFGRRKQILQQYTFSVTLLFCLCNKIGYLQKGWRVRSDLQIADDICHYLDKERKQLHIVIQIT